MSPCAECSEGYDPPPEYQILDRIAHGLPVTSQELELLMIRTHPTEEKET